MAYLRTYHPNSVVLPKELVIKKGIPRSLKGFPEEQFKGFNRPYLFYDIAYTADNKSLIAIGECYAFIDKLPPIKFFLNGVQLKHSIITQAIILIVEIELPKENFLQNSLSIELPTYKWNIELQSNQFFSQDHTLTLSTMQKNNNVQWIIDWTRYHHRVHGVTRVIIYDNDSDDLETLKEKLRNISETIEIIVVYWHYPYRIKIDQKYVVKNKIQISVFNHCNYIFKNNGWLLNMDIDEYLAGGEVPLAEFLNKQEKKYLIFERYRVPNINENRKILKTPTFRDYSHTQGKEESGKYVAKFDENYLFYTHCLLKIYRLTNSRIIKSGGKTKHKSIKDFYVYFRNYVYINVIRRVDNLIIKFADDRLFSAYKFVRHVATKVEKDVKSGGKITLESIMCIFMYLPCRIYIRLNKTVRENESSNHPFIIYHYEALTTGWRNPDRLKEKNYLPQSPNENYTKDDSILKLAIKHGVVDNIQGS